MKLVVVGRGDSMNLARWVGCLAGLGWDLHLFPLPPTRPERAPFVHGQLVGATVWDSTGDLLSRLDRDVIVRSPRSSFERSLPPLLRPRPARGVLLARLIRRLQPDAVHALELHHGGYAALAARDLLGPAQMPPLIVSNHGSDLYLYGRHDAHEARLRRLLDAADVYHCAADRDVELGLAFGFRGAVGPQTPPGGGYDIPSARLHVAEDRPSRRRTIALDAADEWTNRVEVALAALARSGARLKGHRVELYSASVRTLALARTVLKKSGVEVEPVGGALAPVTPQAMLALFGRTRLALSLNASGAFSTTTIEAMLMGAYPVHSRVAASAEWLEAEITGTLVDPDDVDAVAGAITGALMDRKLVDRAALLNAEVAREVLAFRVVHDQALALYDLARRAWEAAGEPASPFSANGPVGGAVSLTADAERAPGHCGRSGKR